MSDQLYLVDFENVPGVDLGSIGLECRVIVFTGADQKSVPLTLVTATQRFGDRLEWRRVDANGRNALDFFIACELGRVQANANGTACTIVSNDKGFDPLLRYLNAVGVSCRRIGTLPVRASASKPGAAPESTATPVVPVGASLASTRLVASKPAAKPKAASASKGVNVESYKRVMDILAKIEKKSRPRKHKTLTQAVSSFFQKQISKSDVGAIIAQMVSDKKITDKDGAISYSF